MLNNLFESNAVHSWHLSPALWSAVAHGALIVTATAATRPPPPAAPERAEREVVYFLPLLPKQERIEAVGVQWARGDEAGAGLKPEAELGLAGAGAGETGAGAGRRGRSKRPNPPKPAAGGEEGGGTVYMEAELEHPVERDPASAGPAYPEALLQAGISGWVTVQFVVDTTGHADTTSFAILEATHPEFGESVRQALPGMLFRPAELQGRFVRQLVRQDFRFRLERPQAADSTAADSTAADSIATRR